MEKVLILLVTAILFAAMLAAVAGGMAHYSATVQNVIDFEMGVQQTQTR